ncbi:MAG: HAMP domain-containing sensor histidine kinase, partial [Bacteroidota bacterium]|nr:HAMP domain-containing sensor histidine kinase [Bacteroidota bacterium]
FSVFFILKNTEVKEKETKKVLVVNLANERDQIGEMLLSSVEKKILNDTVVRDLLPGYLENEGIIVDHLRRKYFNGYFRKYDIQISICNPNDELTLLQENSTEVVKCYDFFNNMLNDDGLFLNVSNFYFLDNQNGSVSYVGQFEFNKSIWTTEMSLFISLDSKLISEELGYPELLLNSELSRQEALNNYSYAKFRNKKLITKSGKYVYVLKLPHKWDKANEFLFVNEEKFEHLIYKSDEHNTIVISNPKLSILDIIAFFSYLFVFYYLIMTIILFVVNFPNNIKSFNYDFKNKIKFSMIGVLLLSLIIVGTITVYYNVIQYEKTLNENIGEKLQSVDVEMKHKLGGEESLTSDYEEYLKYLLVKFSNVFYIDINIYNTNGTLLASSRPQVFEKGLMGKKMNVDAYRNVAINHAGRYIHKEKIGDLSYYSAYVPFYNDNNKLLAYLNLPYFTTQSAMKKGIYTLIVAFVNIYFFLIFFSIVIVVFISNNITKPLKLIQNKFKEINLEKQNEQIVYNSNDEIGSLINEYNRMLGELSLNAERLARSERETAWREMAKQIAHEIKNPLTPMKLSVQYLQRARSENVDDFDQRLNKFSNSMIEQIDSLSSIATAFSNFAKMPKTKNKKIDLISVINNSVNLFQNNKEVNIHIENEMLENIFLYADREQLKIVISNILKNAIQAIPENRKAIVKIRMHKSNDRAIIEIEDNGDGISDNIKAKLFTPNFTTKSSGMGLGLAIVKNIVENAEGKIWFRTKLNVGTSFYLSFPLFEGEWLA